MRRKRLRFSTPPLCQAGEHSERATETGASIPVGTNGYPIASIGTRPPPRPLLPTGWVSHRQMPRNGRANYIRENMARPLRTPRLRFVGPVGGFLKMDTVLIVMPALQENRACTHMNDSPSCSIVQWNGCL